MRRRDILETCRFFGCFFEAGADLPGNKAAFLFIKSGRSCSGPGSSCGNPVRVTSFYLCNAVALAVMILAR